MINNGTNDLMYQIIRNLYKESMQSKWFENHWSNFVFNYIYYLSFNIKIFDSCVEMEMNEPKLILLSLILVFVFLKDTDSCCCLLWSEGDGLCGGYCNIFGCNCGDCPTCPASDNSYCYYRRDCDDGPGCRDSEKCASPCTCEKSDQLACARFRIKRVKDFA